MEWSSQQFFKLDEQLRKLRAQLEDIAWKLDTWERGVPATSKVRFETKQYLQAVYAAQRSFFSYSDAKSETPLAAPTPAAVLVPPPEPPRETSKEPKDDNSTTLFNDTQNQTENPDMGAGRQSEPLGNSSNLDLEGINHQAEPVSQAAQQIQFEVELLRSELPGIQAFKFLQRQPFRTVEINERNYVEAESIFVAVCLVLMDWINANDRPRLAKLRQDFISSDCRWVDGNQSLPAEQANLTGDICKKVFLEYLSKLNHTTTNEILEEFDIGYVLETMIRQYLMEHSKEIPQEQLTNFNTALSQVQVLVELAGPDRILSDLEINDLEQGHEVTIVIGDSQCKLLTDMGSNSCFIEI